MKDSAAPQPSPVSAKKQTVDKWPKVLEKKPMLPQK